MNTKHLFKILKFSNKELLLLIEAWFLFVKWDFLISFTQYKYWKDDINCLSNPDISNTLSTTPPEQKTNTVLIQEKIKFIIKLSEIAGRFNFRKMNCLRRCITQQKLLEKRKIHTCMHIGISIEEEQVKAHAWLTYNGKIINDSKEITSHYNELKSANHQSIFSSLK